MKSEAKKNKPFSTAAVTIFDVAREAGVHASTVSRALNPRQSSMVKEPTRVRILEVVEQLGYRPDLVARGLRRGRTGTVGVIVADLGNTYATPIIHGLSAAVAAEGMIPMIAESNDDHERLRLVVDHVLSRRVDAIVVAAGRRGDEATLDEAAKQVPVVLAARPMDKVDVVQVIHDEPLGGRLVARHLEELGHKVAVQLPGPDDIGNFRRRQRGFSAHWKKAGLEELEPPAPGRPSIEEGRRMMQEVLDSRRLPTAIFANNDFLAVGALSALHEQGVDVPGRVSVVGFNDLPTSAFMTPPLTTVRTKTYDIGFTAGTLIGRLLHGESVSSVKIAPEMMVRGTTGPAPH